MRQPEDTRTLDLLDPPKRGRGRPRSANPLTPAQRAKRYRDKKRALKKSAPVTIKTHSRENDALFWRQKYEAETRRAADLYSLADMFIKARMQKKSIPADVFRNICQSFLKA